MGQLDEILERVQAMPPKEKAELMATAAKFVAANTMIWVPSPGPQTDAYLSAADVLLFGGGAGGGKLLAHDTVVPVPLFTSQTGYKNHGDLRPGDFVFGRAGQPVMISCVTDEVINTDAYEIEFDTGETFKADGDHLWHTFTEKERLQLLRCDAHWMARRRSLRPSRAVAVSKKPWTGSGLTKRNKERHYEITIPTGGVRTTREIAMSIRTKRGAINHSISAIAGLDLPEENLPIEPYLFGLWLGDGTSRSAAIGMDSRDWPAILPHLPAPTHTAIDNRPPRKSPFVSHSFGMMAKALRTLGVHRNKHIPALYLRASMAQRIALFQGLMDTDGTCSKKKGSMELGFSNPRLAADALELAASLGVKATLNIKKTKPPAKDHFRFTFVAPFSCFRLPRKATLQKLEGFRKTTSTRYIVGTRKIASVPMRCIKVVASDGLYLIGRSFIATHNSDLLLGLAFNAHERSLLMRREYTDLGALTERAIKINQTKDGFNGSAPPKLVTRDKRRLDFGAAKNVGDEEAWQGQPHDLLAIDEAAHWAEQQIRFLMTWNRSTKPGQRCRVVLATNPPVNSVGLWLIEFFAPWLDPRHPRPAAPGELRWYVTDEFGKDMECDGPAYVLVNSKRVKPLSRTFIPASVSDNPFLAETDYAARLDSLPEPYRSAFRDGNFMLGLQDDLKQVIPTDWVRQAQARWTPQPPRGVPMCAIGVDVARGGADDTVLAPRHDAWFAPLVRVPGVKTPLGSDVAGLVVTTRRDSAMVIIDMGGGYGGAPYEHLANNGFDSDILQTYNGANTTNARTRDDKLGFPNVRSMAIWRFRELLDPDQPGGSPCALPDDPRLVADLTAPRFEITSRGIKVESKEDVCDRLRRSTDAGDSVVMSWTAGPKMATHGPQWMLDGGGSVGTPLGRRQTPRVNMGHQQQRRG